MKEIELLDRTASAQAPALRLKFKLKIRHRSKLRIAAQQTDRKIASLFTPLANTWLADDEDERDLFFLHNEAGIFLKRLTLRDMARDSILKTGLTPGQLIEMLLKRIEFLSDFMTLTA